MKALSIGLVRQLPDGRFEVRSPRLAQAGMELQRLGVPLERSLEFTGNVREQADRLAQTYVDLFLERSGRRSSGPGCRARAGRPYKRRSSACTRWPPSRCSPSSRMAMKDAVDRASAQALKRMAGDSADRPAAAS